MDPEFSTDQEMSFSSSIFFLRQVNIHSTPAVIFTWFWQTKLKLNQLLYGRNEICPLFCVHTRYVFFPPIMGGHPNYVGTNPKNGSKNFMGEIPPLWAGTDPQNESKKLWWKSHHNRPKNIYGGKSLILGHFRWILVAAWVKCHQIFACGAYIDLSRLSSDSR